MTADDVRARFEAWLEREYPHEAELAYFGLDSAVEFKEAAEIGYRAAHADLSGEVRELADALRLAVRQNEHDMLMTGDELRTCTSALAKFTQEKP